MAFLLLVLFQVMSFPGQFAHMARENPDRAYLQVAAHHLLDLGGHQRLGGDREHLEVAHDGQVRQHLQQRCTGVLGDVADGDHCSSSMRVSVLSGVRVT